jgi:hypothetical protein
MREALSVAVVATLLIAAVIDVVAAGVKTSVVRNQFYCPTWRKCSSTGHANIGGLWETAGGLAILFQ